MVGVGTACFSVADGVEALQAASPRENPVCIPRNSDAVQPAHFLPKLLQSAPWLFQGSQTLCRTKSLGTPWGETAP